jgi:16S rRNA G527 N7-methylase RsmG
MKTELSKLNLDNIQIIKDIIEIEENVEISFDEVLARVLRFYKSFVPYN